MSESLDRAVRNAREVRERLESDDDKRRRDERAAFVAARTSRLEVLAQGIQVAGLLKHFGILPDLNLVVDTGEVIKSGFRGRKSERVTSETSAWSLERYYPGYSKRTLGLEFDQRFGWYNRGYRAAALGYSGELLIVKPKLDTEGVKRGIDQSYNLAIRAGQASSIECTTYLLPPVENYQSEEYEKDLARHGLDHLGTGIDREQASWYKTEETAFTHRLGQALEWHKLVPGDSELLA